MECMNCGRKQPELVKYCPKCIKEDLKATNAKRVKQGKLPYR